MTVHLVQIQSVATLILNKVSTIAWQKMYTGTAILLSWLAISVSVYRVDGYQRNLAKAEIESWKTALIAKWLQHEMAQTEEGTYNVYILDA